jgi:hypothetical protein
MTDEKTKRRKTARFGERLLFGLTQDWLFGGETGEVGSSRHQEQRPCSLIFRMIYERLNHELSEVPECPNRFPALMRELY